MSNFSIFMFIFATCVFLIGLYMFSGSGHKLEIMTYRAAFKNLTKSEWKNIGKWTMIVSIIPFLLALLGYIFGWE